MSDARIENGDEPPEPLDDVEHCRRCFSAEVYPTQERARMFALAFLLIMAGFLLLAALRGAMHVIGHAMSQQIERAIELLLLVSPFVVALYTSVAPKKRCRNCGLEWRGTQRPS